MRRRAAIFVPPEARSSAQPLALHAISRRAEPPGCPVPAPQASGARGERDAALLGTERQRPLASAILRHTPPRLVADPYSRLALGYDAVMAHVDYDGWADYVYELLQRHAPEASALVEIGCGTGSLALALSRLDDFDLRGYDGSAAMVEVAQRKAARQGAEIAFAHAVFADPIPGPLADAIVLVYDGLNYLLHERQIATLLRHVHAALRPGGVFIVDQSTPANSLNHVGEFDDEGRADAFAYTRAGSYDPETRLHTTVFDLSAEGQSHSETHVQRAYSLEELQALFDASPLAPEAAYDAFSTEDATSASERIHWVARKPDA